MRNRVSRRWGAVTVLFIRAIEKRSLKRLERWIQVCDLDLPAQDVGSYLWVTCSLRGSNGSLCLQHQHGAGFELCMASGTRVRHELPAESAKQERRPRAPAALQPVVSRPERGRGGKEVSTL